MQDRKDRSITYASPTDEEVDQISQSLSQYLPRPAIDQLLEEHHLLIGRGRRSEVFLISSPLWTLYQRLLPHRNPYFLGIFLGELTRDRFSPSLQILSFLVQRGMDSIKVVTTPAGEQLFLYGQALSREHLAVIPPDLKRGIGVLVVNQKGEGLGYGRIKQIKGETITISNQQDLGWYLRRGQ
ncbi:MAG: NIP7 N-terminal domain-related protein [Candidatus Hodarchaeota archaeon]